MASNSTKKVPSAFITSDLFLMIHPIFVAFANPFTMRDGSVLILPSAIVAIIVVVGIIAFVCGMRMKYQIAAARRILRRIETAVESATAETPLIVAHRGKSGTCGSLAGAVSDASKCMELAEVRETVNQMALREESRAAAAFLSFAVGSVLILGLMGTFLAFGELVHRSGLDGDSFQEGIPTVVKNLNLAFVASVAGILSSIILLFVSVVLVKPQRMLLLADLENFLVRNHLNLAAETATTASGADGDLNETLRNVATDLAGAVGAIAAVAERFDKMALSSPESMAGALEAVRAEIAQGATRYERLVDTATATQSAVEGISERTAAALEASVKEHRTQQLEVYEQARQFSTNLLLQISVDDKSRLKEYRDGLRETGDRLANVAESWKSDSGTLVAAFQKDRDDYVKELAKAGENSASRFEASAGKSLDAIAAIAASMEKTCGEIASQAVGRLEKAYEEQMKDLTGSAEIARKQTESARQTLELLERHLAPLGKSLEAMHSGATATLKTAGEAAASLVEIPTRLDGLIERYAGGISSLTTEASNMSNTVRSLGTDADTVFRTAGESLNRISNQLAQVIELGRQSGYRTNSSMGTKFAAWMRRTFQFGKRN